MTLFTQIVILLIVLACMVMVLLAIRQLAHFESFDDAEETTELRREIKDDNPLLSKNNVFSTLIEAEPEKDYDFKDKYYTKNLKDIDYNSNSKEPWERKE